MKRFAYILLIGISAIISCTDSPGPHYPRYSTFPHEKAISARVIELDTALFRYPFRVAVKDSMAIVMDLHNADYYFHAFTYPDWKHIVSFGKRGEGPEEMLSAETFQFDSPDTIYALDANKMQISRWAVSAGNRSATRQEVIPLDKSLVRSLDFYATDSCFLIPDYLGEHRYWQVDYSGKPIKSIGKIPTEKDFATENRPALAQAWRSFIDYNPHNGILAMVTQLGNPSKYTTPKKIPIPYYMVRTASPSLKASKAKASRPELWDSAILLSQTNTFTVYSKVYISRIN